MPLKPINFPETRQFNLEIQLLLKPHNPHARSLLAFIYRTIRQFRLEQHVTEIDIFIEAYLRGVRYTQQQGRTIHQPKAWIRKTAYNIIRECKREHQRYCSVAFDEMLEHSLAGHPPEAVDDGWKDRFADNIQAVLSAFQSLSAADQQLIQWRVVEGRSWETIRELLIGQGEPQLSGAALRKRGQRALERLRHAYHQRSQTLPHDG
jgi:DNA-directed RNA polymerase specialized sigma24 family protein